MISVFRVRGRSMEPHFYENDYVIVSTLHYKFAEPSINDIVIVRHPETGEKMIKRIQAVAGERIFVVGENDESTDSRAFGSLDKKSLLGKVLKRIF